MNEQQIVEAITNLTTTLSSQMNGSMLLIALMVAGTFFVNAITGYRRAQRDVKESDRDTLVLQRMADMERNSRERSERDQAELQRQREVNEKQRQIIVEQQETAAAQAIVSKEHLQAIKEHNRLLAETKRMAEERDEKLQKDLLQFKSNLAGGVSLAEENNELLKALSAKVNNLPAAIAEAFKPSVDELHKIAEGFDKLTSEIHERIKDTAEVQKTIEGLRSEFTTALKNLSERVEEISKLQSAQSETVSVSDEKENANESSNPVPPVSVTGAAGDSGGSTG